MRIDFLRRAVERDPKTSVLIVALSDLGLCDPVRFTWCDSGGDYDDADEERDDAVLLLLLLPLQRPRWLS